MNAGDRVRVSEAYGVRWPWAAKYVGEEGVVCDDTRRPGWEDYVSVKLDCDGGAWGLFLRDELELAGK